MKILNYKGFVGSYKYIAEDNMYFGKVELISDLVTFTSFGEKNMQKTFESAVDDYLETCKIHGKNPFNLFNSLKLQINLSPELYSDVCEESKKRGLTINQFATVAIIRELLKLTGDTKLFVKDDLEKAWNHGDTRSPKDLMHLNNFNEYFNYKYKENADRELLKDSELLTKNNNDPITLIRACRDFYMWMQLNEFDHNLIDRVEKKAKQFIESKGWSNSCQ